MDILLYNANIITMEESTPRARSLKISGDRIVWVGQRHYPNASAQLAIDCRGRTVLPGFHDAHMHLLAYASNLNSLDCSPKAVTDIGDIQRSIRQRVQERPKGSWIKGWGYNEFQLAEGRHPNRHDLDSAAPEHPARLVHRSGHASVLNSLAMRLVGMDSGTAEPPGSMIDRDLSSGEPTGLLYEMEGWLNERVPQPSYDEIADGVKKASNILSSSGITYIQDATPSNGPRQGELLYALQREGLLLQGVTMMAGRHGLSQLLEQQSILRNSNQLRVGALKILLDRTTGRVYPSHDELMEHLQWAREIGAQVALHAVEVETLEVAVEALERAQSRSEGPARRDRIEHASVCPPELARRIEKLRAIVVTQPSFVYHNGDRYLAQVEDKDQRWLYPLRTLSTTGVICAGSSDAPVAPPDPLTAIYAAATRRTAQGHVLHASECIGVKQALEMYTQNAAFSAGLESEIGSITSGKRADIVMLDRDITAVPIDEVMLTEVTMTIIGGKVVYESADEYELDNYMLP